MIKQLETISQMAELIYDFTDRTISDLIIGSNKKTILNSFGILHKVSSKILEDAEWMNSDYSYPRASLYSNYHGCVISRYCTEQYLKEAYHHHIDGNIIFFYSSNHGSRRILVTENSVTFMCCISNSGYIDDPEKDITYKYIFSDEEKNIFFK